MNKQKNREDFAPILSLITSSNDVLLCTHLAPDGDALGSMLALGSLVRRMGKQVTMICHDIVPGYLCFLPGREDILLPAQVEGRQFDLALSIDASDLKRLGESAVAFRQARVCAQMDHHKTNEGFADHNLVLEDLPASGSIVLRMMEAADLAVTREEAVCLYTAITTDTGNLCFGSVSDETFEQIASLMRAGLPLADTARRLHLMRDKEHVLMLGRALRSLEFLLDGRLTMMTLTREDYLQSGADISHTDKIVNYGLYMPGVEMACLAHEMDDGIKFSLRSIEPREVSGLAARFGGGGHAQASGCTVYAPLNDAVRLIREAALEELSR